MLVCVCACVLYVCERASAGVYVYLRTGVWNVGLAVWLLVV